MEHNEGRELTTGRSTMGFSVFWVFKEYLDLIYFIFLFFIYLFLAVLCLCCCVQAFSRCSEQGLLFIVVHGLRTAVASLVAEHGL